MPRWPDPKPEEKKEDVIKSDEPKPEEKKEEIKGFICARCGGISKTQRNNVEVCADCFAPTHWTA